MVLYAPAKVNLYLRVLGKRSDGYHNIETIFERIAIFDKIDLRSLKDNKIKVFSDHPEIAASRESLIYKTVSLLKRESKVSKGIEVRIYKRIPIASGLGGGSSDAAAVLMGLNKLWKLSLSLSALLEFGKGLGTDIPFFLSNSSFAMARGRGDEIMPLDWKVKWWHLLISFPIGLLSKEIYNMYAKNVSLRLTRQSCVNKILPFDIPAKSGFVQSSLKQPKRNFCGDSSFGAVKFENITSFISNDLEEIVLKREPIVARLKKALKDMGITHALVSGSGPSVFSLFERRKEAIRVKERLIKRFPIVKRKGWQIFIVPTL